MPNLSSAQPIRKVVTGALAGAISTIAVWVLDAAWQIKVPGDVTAAITTVLTFATSYFTPSTADELAGVPGS